MDAEDLVDKAVWDVLVKVKKQDILKEIGSVITFGYATKEEEQILLWLQNEKVLRLQNLSRYPLSRPPGVIPEEIKLELIQPEFNEIYQEYDDYFNPPHAQKVKTNEAKSKVKEIILLEGLIGNEKLFLQILSSMKPISLRVLSSKVGARSIKELKARVQEKVNRHQLNIKTIKAAELGKDSFYQLEFLTK